MGISPRPDQLSPLGPRYLASTGLAIFLTPLSVLVARAYIEQLNQASVVGTRIVTTLELNKPFFDAEAYHQDYLALNPEEPYIVIYDLPKVGNLRSLFPKQYRAVPVLVGTKN